MRASVYLRSYETKKGEKRHYLVVREVGKRDRHIQLGCLSKREAENRRIQTLNELLNGNYQRVATVQPFFSEFCDRVISEYVEKRRAPRTVKDYRNSLKVFKREFRGLRLDQIRREDIERVFGSLNWGSSTKNGALSYLRSVFKKAVEWRYIAYSPAEKISRWKLEKGGSRALTQHELSLLLDRGSPWQQMVLKLLVMTGMRSGELSQLRFADVDWENKVLRVVSDRHRKTKNRKSRVIPLTSDLETELRFLKDKWPNMTYGGRNGREEPFKPRTGAQKQYVLCHKDGRPIKSFKTTLYSLFRREGLEGVSPHSLRKTFCSLLARHGVHPKAAQRLLGHSDIRLTMDVYTEVGDDQLRDAVNMLPTLRSLRKEKFHVVGGVK